MRNRHSRTSFYIHFTLLLIVIAIPLLLIVGDSGAANGVDITIDFASAVGNDPNLIDPEIYGINYHPEVADRLQDTNLTARRSGGNRTSGANWETAASYSGTDVWPPQNDNFLCFSVTGSTTDPACDTPGWMDTEFLDNYPVGTASDYYSLITLQMAGLVEVNGTLQMAGWVADTVDLSLDSTTYNPDTHYAESWFEKPGGVFQYPPDLTDDAVYMDERIDFLIDTYGNAGSASGVKAYSLDNEPGLWGEKHPHLRTPAGQSAEASTFYANSVPVTVDELLTKSAELAEIVKDLDSNADIFGPALYGWNAYLDLQGANDYVTECVNPNYTWFIDCYLDKMSQAASGTAHSQLLDVLDVHWYPELYARDVYPPQTEPDWKRIMLDGIDIGGATMQTARMQAPRALWDDDYLLYIDAANDMGAGIFTNNPTLRAHVPLLDSLETSITNYAPNVQIGFTEYSFGGENHVSGGIAVADALGIFSERNVKFSSFWTTNAWSTDSADLYVPAAYKLYRNYDQNNSTYGSTALDVTTTDTPNASQVLNSSVYASLDDAGNLHIIILNKDQSNALTGSIDFANATNVYEATNPVWGFNSGSAVISTSTGATLVQDSVNEFTYSVPAYSAHHFVLPQGTGTPPTPTPSASCGVSGFNPAGMQSYFGNVQSWNGAANGLEVASNEGIYQTVSQSIQLGESYMFKGNYQTADADASFKLRVLNSSGAIVQEVVKDEHSGLGAAPSVQPFELSLIINQNAVNNGANSIQVEMWNGNAGGSSADPLFIGDFELLGPCTNPPTPTPTPPPAGGSLSGQIWNDIDGDGIRDSFEGSVDAPLTVHLWADTNDNGTLESGEYVSNLSTVNTYTFSNLDTNVNHAIQVTGLGANDTFSAKDQGADDSVDSDVYSNGYTDMISLDGSNGIDPAHVDVGVYDPSLVSAATLSGQVWEDTNGNGQIDSGEPLAVGYDLFSFIDTNCDNTPEDYGVSTYVQTDANGAYTFSNLHAGNCYVVQVYTPNQGGPYAETSAVLAIGSNTLNIELPEINVPTYTCNLDSFDPEGMVRFFGSPGDVTHTNGTYVFNAGGLGIEQSVSLTTQPDVTFKLKGEYKAPTGADYTFTLELRDAGSSVATQTEFSAQYQPTGSYEPFEVEVVVPAGGADEIRPIIWHSSGSTGLEIRDLSIEYDCSTPPTSGTSVAGRVWDDANGNGVREAQEGNLVNETVTVTLWEDDGSGNIVSPSIGQVTTSGGYSFTNLDDTKPYQVQFSLPSGKTFSNRNQGSDDAVDSDVYSNGYTGSLVVDGSSSVDLMNIDAGIASSSNAPTAQFSSSINGLAVDFFGGGSSDPDGTIVDYAWTFGDGQSSSGGSSTVSHTYAQAGSYDVTLTVTDNDGLTHSVTMQISVGSSSGNVAIEIANASGVAGYQIGIFGSGFGASTGSVSILGTAATVDSWSDTFIRVTVPDAPLESGQMIVTTTGSDTASWPFTVYAIDPAFSLAADQTFENLLPGQSAVLDNPTTNIACYEFGTNAAIPASSFLTNYTCNELNGYADFNVTGGVSVDVGETLTGDYYFQFFSDANWYKYTESPSGTPSYPMDYTIDVGVSQTGVYTTVHAESDNLRGSRIHKVTIPNDGNDYRWLRMRVTDSADNATFRLLEIRLFKPTGSGSADTIAIFGDSLTEASFDILDTTYGVESLLKAARPTATDPIVNIFGLSGANTSNLLNQSHANDLHDALAIDDNKDEIRVWGIGLGTNDYGSPSIVETNLESAIQHLLSLGRVPIIARAPDLNDNDSAISAKLQIMAAVDGLAAEYGLIPGPDFFTEFRLNVEENGASYFGGDGIHHTLAGKRELQRLWADALAGIPDSGGQAGGPQIEIANISGVSSYEVGIFGSDFGTLTSTVTILNTPAAVVEWTDTFVRVIVPNVADGVGNLKLTRSDGATTTSPFTVYTINSALWLNQPAATYTNVSHGKPATLEGENATASQCYQVGTGALIDASDYLTAYTCQSGIAAKFNISATNPARITINFEQPLADGDYLFQFFSVASWSAGDGCSDQTGFPVAYEILGSADGTNWSAPALASEQANARGNRSHNVSLSGGIQYLRLEVTDTIGDCYGSDGIKDFQMKEVRVYKANNGNTPTEAVALYGDSITVGALNSNVGATHLNSLLDGFPSDIPFAPYGFVGRKAEGMFYDGFNRPDLLADVYNGDAIANSAMYWGIALGTNDMNLVDENDLGFTDPNSQFNKYDTHMRNAIIYLRDNGRVPIIARFPDTDQNSQYSGFGFLAAKKILLNEIDSLNAEFGLIPGPDLYTEFRLNIERDNDSWLSDFDGTHLDGDGHGVWVQMWADAINKGFTFRNP